MRSSLPSSLTVLALLAFAACSPPPTSGSPSPKAVVLPGGARTLKAGVDAAPVAGDLRILQFDGPITAADKAALRAEGIAPLEYVSGFAYLARVPARALQRLSSLGRVRALRALRPEDRIAPALKRALASRPAGARVRVRVGLFRDRTPADVEPALRALGATVEARSAGLVPFVEVTLPAGAVSEVAGWGEVSHLEEPETFHVLNAVTRPLIESGSVDGGSPLTDEGLDGSGQIVGVTDDGLDLTSGYFYDPDVPEAGPTHRKVLAYIPYADGVQGEELGHGTHVSGTVAGEANTEWDGIASHARLVFFDIGFPNDLSLDVPSDLAGDALGPIRDLGAFIDNNSWGSGTVAYTSMSQSADAFAWAHKDFLTVFAAGNDGPDANTVVAPTNAKNALTVGSGGAPPKEEAVSTFSSRGAELGRRKPELVARGELVVSAASLVNGSPGHLETGGMSGTSMAAPAVAGAAALVRQYFMEGRYPSGARTPAHAFTPSAALMAAVLMNGTRNMTGAGGDLPAPRPSRDQGMGRLVLDDALARCAETRRLFVDDVGRLTTGESRSYEVQVTGSGPLQVELVWTDAVNSSGTLVNDLDLTVTDGTTTWQGGVFSNGWSTPGGDPDRLNPNEAVFLEAPAPGTYTVTVSGYNVPVGEETDDRQPYALVVSGALTEADGVSLAPDLAVLALSPVDEVVAANPRPSVQWTAQSASGQDLSWTVEWSADPAFTTVLAQESGLAPSGTPAVAAPEADLSAGTYSWRLRVTSASGCEQTSAARRYTYDPASTAPSLTHEVGAGETTLPPVSAAEVCSAGWKALHFTVETPPEGGVVGVRLEYRASPDADWAFVPNDALPGGAGIFTSSPVDLTGLDAVQYPELRVKWAVLEASGAVPPRLTSVTYEFKTYVDALAPVLGAVAELTQEATSASGASVTYATPTAEDVRASSDHGACIPPAEALPAACTPASGSTFPLGTTQVSCSATDAGGNEGSATFAVTVKDTTPPTLGAAPQVTVGKKDETGAVATWSAPSTQDAVDGEGVASCTPASGTRFAVGTTQVTCTAEDAAGNEAVPVTFTVTVEAPTVPPPTPTPTPLTPAPAKPEPPKTGCGCGASGPAAPAFYGLLFLLGALRSSRRRRA